MECAGSPVLVQKEVCGVDGMCWVNSCWLLFFYRKKFLGLIKCAGSARFFVVVFTRKEVYEINEMGRFIRFCTERSF